MTIIVVTTVCYGYFLLLRRVKSPRRFGIPIYFSSVLSTVQTYIIFFTHVGKAYWRYSVPPSVFTPPCKWTNQQCCNNIASWEKPMASMLFYTLALYYKTNIEFHQATSANT